jgi:tRNA (cmo5U34)-methyltransferase
MDLRETFNDAAVSYDATRRDLIPCFDDFYGLALNLVPRDRDDAIEVLDLGAGTGLMAQFVLRAFPHASITLIDVADEMLSVARERFAGSQNRIRFVVDDYAQQLPTGSFDLVVSALSIHHLEHPAKRLLFGSVKERLRPQGMFINADQVAVPDGSLAGDLRTVWVRGLNERSVDPAVIEQAFERQRFDIPATADDQIQWLREAGFADAEIVFKYLFFTVFVART